MPTLSDDGPIFGDPIARDADLRAQAAGSSIDGLAPLLDYRVRIASTLYGQGRAKEATAILDDVSFTARVWLGARHPVAAVAAHAIADHQVALGDLHAASLVWSDLADRQAAESDHGTRDIHALRSRANQVDLLMRDGRFDEAVEAARTGVPREAYGLGHAARDAVHGVRLAEARALQLQAAQGIARDKDTGAEDARRLRAEAAGIYKKVVPQLEKGTPMYRNAREAQAALAVTRAAVRLGAAVRGGSAPKAPNGPGAGRTRPPVPARDADRRPAQR